MSFRAAFVTIGQSPRSDMLPEILAHTRATLEVTERGALDGLTESEIDAFAPAPDAPRLVTRLNSGREVVVTKAAIDQRIRAIISDLDEGRFDLIVLLCTGRFEDLQTRTPLLQAQEVVDHLVHAIAGEGARVGVILPEPEQIREFHGLGALATKVISASPFDHDQGEALREAGIALADTDLILLNCMSFTEAMRTIVRRASGRPAVAPRRLLAHAIDIVLS